MEDLKLNNFGKIEETKNTEKKPKYVKASVVFLPDDLEFYRDFIYHNKVNGDLRFGSKEALNEAMNLLRKKFKDVKPRPDSEREREKEIGRPRKNKS